MSDEIVPLAERRAVKSCKPTDSSNDQWLRRQAVVVVSQLPEGRDEALAVLRLAQCLVNSFLGKR